MIRAISDLMRRFIEIRMKSVLFVVVEGHQGHAVCLPGIQSYIGHLFRLLISQKRSMIRGRNA